MSRHGMAAALVGLFCLMAPCQQAATDAPARLHASLGDVPWSAADDYPPALQAVVRWKDLVGGTGGHVVPQPDVFMGVLELAPGAIYSGHRHPAPEMYYVVSGTAQWTVGDQTFTARAGTAVYHPANAVHRMTNTGGDVLRAVYMWWAPGGDRTVLSAPVVLVEPVPQQPSQARFSER